MNKFIYTIIVLCNSHNPEYPHEIKYTNLSKTECSHIINFYDTLTTNKVYTYKVDSTYLNNKDDGWRK